MSGELARRDDGFMPVPLTRALAKKLNQLQGAAILQRAEIEAEEQNAAYKADRRMANCHVLYDHLFDCAGELDDKITRVTKDKPGLEMLLRPAEEDFIIAGRAYCRWYGGRPL
jgi:hypothetical protein